MKNALIRRALLCAAVFTAFLPSVLHAENTTVTIGTGGVTGVFYQAGSAIARIVNSRHQEYGLQCKAEATEGSVANINQVIAGTLDVGFTQSDRQYQAVFGAAEWKEKGPQKELRAMFSLYSEGCTLCATVESGIKNISDLKGRRVNLGNIGSGHRQNSIDALNVSGIDYKKDLIAESIEAEEAPRLLQEGKLDAFFYTVGHPTGAIFNAISGKKKVRIISMPDIAAKLAADYPYYVKVRIPVAYYLNAENSSDIDTFGVKATLVTSSRMSNLTAYIIAKELFENLSYFKSLHVAFEELNKEDMLRNLSAPLHPGAVRYYKEAGLMK